MLTYGKGESYIAKKLVSFESELPSNFKLAYLPNYGRVRLRLSATGENKNRLESEMDHLISKLYSLIGNIIVGYDNVNPIEFEISKKLIEIDKSLSTAESLTGGLLSSRLTLLAGASKFFKKVFNMIQYIFVVYKLIFKKITKSFFGNIIICRT